jgi:hypothetical protein
MSHNSRALGAVPACAFCGKPRTRICDGQVTTYGYQVECRKPMCDACATSTGPNIDHCPDCKKAKNGVAA